MRLTIALCFLLALACVKIEPCYAWVSNAGFFNRAGPGLLYPVTNNIDLTGKEYLAFKWRRGERFWTDHYIFKLYKGYNTTADNLILKAEYRDGGYPIRVPVSEFEESQVYTWVLVQVFIGGRKSDKSFSSFKIIKK
jgi:hypothetical protein